MNTDDLEIFLLGFFTSGKDGRKASYAARVGYPIHNSLKPLYHKHLSDFDMISVREKSSAMYLKDILGYEPEIVLDADKVANAIVNAIDFKPKDVSDMIITWDKVVDRLERIYSNIEKRLENNE